MADPRNETVIHPFTAFNFAVEIEVPGVSRPKICNAAFAECDGLEMTMEVKTIREGGNNGAQIRLTGPLAFGLLTLKRGMTASFDLWDWFSAIQEPGNGKLRATAQVVLFAPSGAAGGTLPIRAGSLRADQTQGACTQRKGWHGRDRGIPTRLRVTSAREAKNLIHV